MGAAGNQRILARWTVEGQPRGLALHEGRIYVGLADRQSVVELDPETGEIRRELVLDSPEIASTKDLVALRIDRAGNRLVCANGSDESVTILSLPDLHIVREITLEGELVRDALPDPLGRYLYVLGRSVHVFDADGNREIRRIADIDPMAIAASDDGKLFAVVGSQEFPNGPATVLSLWDPETLREIDRQPLQTDRLIRSALFAARGSALVVFADDWVGEKPLVNPDGRKMIAGEGGPMRLKLQFGDLVSGARICLPDDVGPQVAAPGPTPNVVFFAEKRCGVSGSFTASARRVMTTPVYGITAHAIGYDSTREAIYATDPKGFVTLYSVPRPRKD